MTNLNALADRVEEARGRDEKLTAEIRCAVFAPPTAYVMQSPFNGAWCIYDGETRDGRPRSYESRDMTQEQRLGDFLTSLDAAMTLAPANSLWSVGSDVDGPYARCLPPRGNGWIGSKECGGRGDTPAAALTAACLRARATGGSHG